MKGSVSRIVSDAPPPGFDFDRLPAPLRDILVNPPSVTAWIPETYTVAISNALRDMAFSSEGELFEWIGERLEGLTTGRLHRAMASMASPNQLSRLASRAYLKFRQGTSRTIIERADNYNIGLIEYPENLFDSLYLDAETQNGHAVDYTEEIHPRYHDWTKRIVDHLDASFMAIDVICEDPTLDPEGTAYVLEINALAEWAHHTFSERRTHDLAGLVIDLAFGLRP